MGVDLLVQCLYLLAGGVVAVFAQFTSCDVMLSKTWPVSLMEYSRCLSVSGL